MHTHSWKGLADGPDGEKEIGVVMHHNGDYSDDVKINIATWYGNPSVRNYSFGGEDFHIAELSVPFAALEELVLTKWQSDIVHWAENSEDSRKVGVIKALLDLLEEQSQ